MVVAGSVHVLPRLPQARRRMIAPVVYAIVLRAQAWRTIPFGFPFGFVAEVHSGDAAVR